MNTALPISLRAAATITASENGVGVMLPDFTGNGYLMLNSSALNTAGNTSNVKLQHSNDNGATDAWADTGVVFGQVDNTGASFQSQYLSLDQFKRYVRVVNTLAGTTPSVTYSVGMIGKTH